MLRHHDRSQFHCQLPQFYQQQPCSSWTSRCNLSLSLPAPTSHPSLPIHSTINLSRKWLHPFTNSPLRSSRLSYKKCTETKEQGLCVVSLSIASSQHHHYSCCTMNSTSPPSSTGNDYWTARGWECIEHGRLTYMYSCWTSNSLWRI